MPIAVQKTGFARKECSTKPDDTLSQLSACRTMPSQSASCSDRKTGMSKCHCVPRHSDSYATWSRRTAVALLSACQPDSHRHLSTPNDEQCSFLVELNKVTHNSKMPTAGFHSLAGLTQPADPGQAHRQLSAANDEQCAQGDQNLGIPRITSGHSDSYPRPPNNSRAQKCEAQLTAGLTQQANLGLPHRHLSAANDEQCAQGD